MICCSANLLWLTVRLLAALARNLEFERFCRGRSNERK